MKLFLSLQLLIMLFLFGNTGAVACVCINTDESISNAIERSGYVFVGRVTKELTPRKDGKVKGDKREWEIKVKSVIKGDVVETVSVIAPVNASQCELSNYNVNADYIFFMLQNGTTTSQYYSLACGATTDLAYLKPEAWQKMLERFKKDVGESRYKELEPQIAQTRNDILEIMKKGQKPRKIKSVSD